MSVQVKAKVVGDIPAHRLLWLTTSEDGETMMVKLPSKGGYPVDFVSTKPLKDGEEVIITITDDKIWRVEAGRKLAPGDNVSADEDGRITKHADHLHSVGYVLDAGEEGDIVRMVRNYKFVDSKMAEGSPKIETATALLAEETTSTRKGQKKKKDVNNSGDGEKAT